MPFHELPPEVRDILAKYEEPWQVYMKLDDIADELAKDAHDRITWQGEHTL